ncbi:hypothetical protein FOZ63_032446 [Perkinsus olseni]|uniref:Hexose transporter 1 n=1 Tax=Perkinsus olseni TaxID=32597 RepID=A0A7J6QFI5_PEROL|nr:hypothetical protein FOZ63_032446 [Perkinsus olseni]
MLSSPAAALLPISGDSFAVFCACASMLGPLTVGLGLGFTGSTIDTMRNSVLAPDGTRIDIGPESNLHVFNSTTASSLFGAALTLGALVGTLSGGPVAEATGRRLALLITSPLSVGAYLAIALGHSPYLLVAARLVAGFSMGICSFVSSVYISEVSPNKLRGFLGACTQLMMAGGITLVYAICLGARISAGSPDPLATSSTFCNWRLVAFICIIPPSLLFCLMFLAVESPRRLATRGRTYEARAVLVRLRGASEDNKSLMAEMDALEAIVASHDKKDGIKARLSVLWSCKRQAVIAVALNGLTQFTGLNALAFYQTTFFLEAGLKDADVLALTVQLSTVIANVVACFLMDRMGRRPLLISSSIGMCISQIMIATFFYEDRDGGDEHLGWLILLGSYCYQITYAWGVGPIRWMVAAELFPDEARGLASSLATTSNWFCAFLFILFLDTVINATSLQAVFYFFACVAAAMTAFEWYMVPETKGKTLEEIQSIFS